MTAEWLFVCFSGFVSSTNDQSSRQRGEQVLLKSNVCLLQCVNQERINYQKPASTCFLVSKKDC